MEWLIDAVVLVVRLALAGFVMWGGWLCFRSFAAPAQAPQAKADGFERVASLVLLALLCTTIAGVA
jgi:hypothetical protein